MQFPHAAGFYQELAVQESFPFPGCFPRNLTLGFPFSSAGYCRPFEQCGDEPDREPSGK